MFSSSKIPVAFVSLVLACGCVYSPRPSAVSPRIADYCGFDCARHAFVERSDAHIDELETQIAHLTMEALYGGTSVATAAREKWTRELSERMQERRRLEGELERARVVNLLEWERMRGGFAGAMLTLDAEVARIGQDLADSWSRAEATRRRQARLETIRVDTGLCPIEVKDAQTDVAVDAKNGAVVLVVTLNRRAPVWQLRRKASELAANSAYVPGVLQHGTTGQAVSIPARITALDVYGGVELTLKPKDESQLMTLQEALARDGVSIENRRCAVVGVAEETG